LQNPSHPETLARSHSVDEIVLAAFDRFQPPVTAIAVGGYGRRELFPYSDVDLLLLNSAALDTAGRERISEFLRTLWDAGLRVSQSVHTPADCCVIHEGNLELTISLLDQRYLCGDRSRHDQLTSSFPKFLNSQRTAIVAHLIQAARNRHAQYGNTIYHLEPDVKEHPGGLRDLHVIHWLRKMKTFETEPLDEPRDHLFSVRSELHRYSRRDNNVLTFEAQEALSSDPAKWMRQYYRNARQILGAANRAMEVCEPVENSLFSQFRDKRSRLSTAEFTVSRERVLLRNPGQLAHDPGAATRLLLYIARHGLKVAPDTMQRLSQMDSFAMTWLELRELLALPHCVAALRVMAESGLLVKFIPEWSRIDCLVVRDFYHRYTVDEHTLVAIQALEQLRANPQSLQKRFAALHAEVDRPDLLHFALLLHDIGKGGGSGDHATQSSLIAHRVMERLQAPQDDLDIVLFLIEQHLALSSIMTSRDLDDAATARQISRSMGTIERLKLLTLMTYADVSAVNPTAMTPWRLEQLWRVYRIGLDEFTRELASDRIAAPEQADPQTASFLEGFPSRYLRTHSSAEIQRHQQLAERAPGIALERLNGAYRITVVTPDRAFLLASISGALASFGFNILKAEAFANRHGLVLDTFVFADPNRTLELNPPEADRVCDIVERTILGKEDVGKLIGKRRRTVPVKRIEPAISSSNGISESATLIEIVAEDRPGLLYDVTSAISSSGANIEVVLIDTEAHRALDVFYVTANGSKLTQEHQERLKTKLIEACKG
jgi:[protein-PII] uridylyltransferase